MNTDEMKFITFITFHTLRTRSCMESESFGGQTPPTAANDPRESAVSSHRPSEAIAMLLVRYVL